MSIRTTAHVAVALAFAGLALTGCNNKGSDAPTTRVEVAPTRTSEPIDVARIKIWVRNSGYSLVTSAINADCSSGNANCPGMPVVADKDLNYFDNIYDGYSEKCSQAITRTNFRLDMVHRVRPMFTGKNADQVNATVDVIAKVDTQKRSATATIKQADGPTVDMHFDFAEGTIRPQCNSGGTAMIEKQ